MKKREALNQRARTIESTGFGNYSENYGGRFVNRDGTANIEKRGISFMSRMSWFHTMIDMPRYRFLTIVFVFYAVLNLFFATVYYNIGVENLTGIDLKSGELMKFANACFFSAQTFTTVGYGMISPNSVATSLTAAFEALIGLLSFALATGLFYGRFSKPNAYVKFSDSALISPYKGGRALMVRLSAYKNANLNDAEAGIVLGMSVKEDGRLVNKFYPLELELQKINWLNLSWTLVHNITENSPLWGFTTEDFEMRGGEFIVTVKAFDDKYNSVVSARTSYTFDEIVYGAKFKMMYGDNEDKTKTLLYLDKLNDFDTVKV